MDKPLDSEANQDLDYAEDEFVEGPENNDTSKYSTFTENNEKATPMSIQDKVDKQADDGTKDELEQA